MSRTAELLFLKTCCGDTLSLPFLQMHCSYAHLSWDSMDARLSLCLCFPIGEGMQDTHTSLSFCCLWVRHRVFSVCYSPSYPRSGGRWWRAGKLGREEHWQINKAVEAQSKGTRAVLRWVLPLSPTWFMYELYGLILMLEYLQELPEFLRETENYNPDTAKEADSYGGRRVLS